MLMKPYCISAKCGETTQVQKQHDDASFQTLFYIENVYCYSNFVIAIMLLTSETKVFLLMLRNVTLVLADGHTVKR